MMTASLSIGTLKVGFMALLFAATAPGRSFSKHPASRRTLIRINQSKRLFGHACDQPQLRFREASLIEVNPPPSRSAIVLSPKRGAPDMRRLSDILYNQTPLTLPPSANVKEACRRMCEKHAGSVLVTDGKGRLSGIFTGRDAIYRVLAVGKDAAATKLADVMTPDPVTMPPEKTAIDALRMMWDGGFRHVPVVKDGRLLGVVSRGDFKGAEQDRLDEERELWEHMR
jgi:CBS domain-containing protein